MLDKIIKIGKSRTVITIIVLFVINGIGGVKDWIPSDYLPAIDALLALAAIYFRITPRQKFSV